MMVSAQTRRNWLIDAAVFCGAILAGSSGAYFLFIPSAGYQGGRNHWFGITVLFERSTWDALHTWSGVLMILAIALHLGHHWRWIVSMSRKMLRAVMSRDRVLSRRATLNLALNVVIGLSFMVTALSGLYFMFAPAGGYQGGRNAGWDPGFLFARSTWNLMHTWAGITLTIAAIVHFAIHWRWVKSVTVRLLRSIRASSTVKGGAGAGTLGGYVNEQALDG
jgi:hypothetical protein